MTSGTVLRSLRRSILPLTAAAFVASFFIFPAEKQTVDAQSVTKNHPKRETRSNYDIRNDKQAVGKIAALRSRARKNAVEVADVREQLASGEASLKRRVPHLKIEHNSELQNAEIIAPDVRSGRSYLTRQNSGKGPNSLRKFLDDNPELFGIKRSDISALKVRRDDSTKNEDLSYVELKQEISGVPVFRGRVRAAFTKDGEMVRVLNNLAPGIEKADVSADFGEPLDALIQAKKDLGDSSFDITEAAQQIRFEGKRVIFGSEESAPSAEKIYFPTEPGVVVPAWRVLIWRHSDAFYVIVDAAGGSVLWRKNITDEQTQPATYSVYANPNAWINVAHSPFPYSPGPIAPDGSQGVGIPRTRITRIGNEPPYTFNQLGWLTDGSTTTVGNAVRAGLDRDGTKGIDPGGEALAADRNFTFEYSPLDPNTGMGDAPVPAIQTYPGTQFQQGVITQLFYVTNWFHDETYRLGFDEASGNFQEINFTGQGVGGDPVIAEAQDSAGTNNANFSTPADGEPGRMQMYLFTASEPDIDGGLDNDVVIHELTHGMSNRLHGDADGLFNDMSRGMGEGWSDFFGMALLSSPSDPIDGIYTTGAYAMFVSGSNSRNSYYGIRRFPTAIMSSVGGPNNRPHNPLTFADIDQTQFNVSDGAFAPRTDGTADQVHRAGEIWCNALWEIRARMIQRLGWEEGNRRIMEFVIQGMKLSPLSPTFVSGRDAIIAAGVAAGTPEDVADMWAGFSIRGLGASASVQNAGGTSIGGTGTARVTESFGLPNVVQLPQVTVSDLYGDNDGYPEPGESITITVPLTNATGQLAADVNLHVVGGGSVSFGTMSGISAASREVAYQVPSAAGCGGSIPVTFEVSSSLGPITFTRNIFIGKPGDTQTSESFDNVEAPNLPAGWTAEAISGGVSFVLSTTSPDTPPNTMFALDPLTVGGGTNLTSPPISVGSSTANVSFRNSYNTEEGWDGGVLEISIAGGEYIDILSAGGTFIQNGYNAIIGAGKNNPVGGRLGWTGDSGGYVNTVVQLPETANGRIVHLRWRFGADDNTAPDVPSPGWRIDGVSLSGAGFVKTFVCSFAPGGSKVRISGRVITPSSGGLRNATVILSGPDGETRRIMSSSAGFYQFDDVDTGHTYKMSVISKRYRFSSRELMVSDQLNDVDFIGIE